MPLYLNNGHWPAHPRMSPRLVNSLIQLLDMQMITMLSVIIYPCHQFFRAFSSDTSVLSDVDPNWLNADIKPRTQPVLLAALGLSV
jgi:hypothetical protein